MSAQYKTCKTEKWSIEMVKRRQPYRQTSKGKAQRATGRARKATVQPIVTIRARPDGRLIEEEVPPSAWLPRLAQDWGYILRARSRWTNDPGLRQFFRKRALGDLGRVGISRDVVRGLVRAHHIEIELHAWNEADAKAVETHEAASEIPWEYLISAATRGEGRNKPLLITRLFRNGSPAKAPPPTKVLFVESAPGRLEEQYEFDSERIRIGAAVRVDMTILETPQLRTLNDKVRTKGPYDAIHVTGIDTHQAARLLKDLYEKFEKDEKAWEKIAAPSNRVRDGMILREGDVPELPVNYVELAKALVNKEKPPRVVTLNLYHSGARTARELVKQGAHAALGFLDEINDELAELFFQAFYWEWCGPEGHLGITDAFVTAWDKTSGGGRLHGSSIVIWMGRSAIGLPSAQSRPADQPEAVEDDRRARLVRLNEKPTCELLQVEFDVEDEVNYSLLHNDRALLTKFTLSRLVNEDLEDITVQVELNVGDQNYPYRYTHLILDEPQLALAGEVKIPLTANLPRSLRERVRSTVYAKVTCGGRTAYEDTRRVTLIPVDEWLDDTRYNPWLPSFVLPRDPAVLKIIASSRRFLIGIADDPAAGFGGYQAIDETNKLDPTAGVDAQVRAIWTAIVNEYRLQYINPPPAYSEQTQRLRTPSDILQSNTGTCVDLALLLASCLEYIDVYPVIVLLTGHAFVGYWRSDVAHERFVEVRKIPDNVPAVGSRVARKAAVPYVDDYGWRLTRLNYSEIMAHVMAGDLVMLEATYLTGAYSFTDAMAEGRANMRSWQQFDSLLDIRLARSASPPVTPLPIIDERRS